ncbi:MAG: YqgE/AlgH family protein, partial [Gemmataceae bacterium]
MRSLLLSLALLLPAATVAQDLPVDLVAKTDALSPADEAKKFKLPPGFTAQLVAAEPDIQKPMQMCFDARGRLWVTTSYLYPFAAEPGKGTDKLFVLSDFDAGGKAKTVQVFDDKLNIPIGVLPLPDGKSVIVSEIGKILKLTDTDGDGKADKREDLFTGFGYRDTHGMYNSYTLLPDGWVYACHGYLNDSTVKGKDGHEVKMNSGNTFRFKPDGSRIEVFTRGQVNPFGMCVDPWLNIYTADCHSRPMTQLIRGAHYDSFGKPHDGLGYAPHVINHMHGSTGLCGLVYYTADHFPKEWNGVMFVGNCVTSRINCDRIEWKGSTPVGKELPDFLASDDPWFRPVDLKIGPDGAMYVSDFYNKIIGHYEVDLKHPGRDKGRGRIWRIVYTGTDGKAPAPTFPRKDWTQASNEELLSDFGHPNTTVRLLAANEAASRASFKPDGANILADAERLSFRMGLYAMVAERTGEMNLDGYKTVIDYAKQNPGTMPPEHLSGLVVRALTSRKEWGAKERAIALDCFKSFDNIRVRRAVIDGVTAHPHADFVEPLLDLVPTIPAEDTHLSMAARVALRNCVVAAGGVDKVKELTTKGDKDIRAVALLDVALSIRTKESAEFLAASWKNQYARPEQRLAAAEVVGRYAPERANAVVPDPDYNRPAEMLAWNGRAQAILRGLAASGSKSIPVDVMKQLNAVIARHFSGPYPEAREARTAAAVTLKLAAAFPDTREQLRNTTSARSANEWFASAATPADLRFFVGYSGWGGGQLEDELRGGSWVPAPPDPALVFDAQDREAVWRRALRSLGDAGADLSRQPPDVSWN